MKTNPLMAQNRLLCGVFKVVLIKKEVMILKVERENIYKTAKVIELDGTVRLIPPLYFGQMIWMDRLGQYRYDKSVPADFWAKRDFLIRRGWHQGYHFDIDWQKGKWKEMGGINTEKALKKEGLFKTGYSINDL